MVFLSPTNKVWKGYVFIGVCLSILGGLCPGGLYRAVSVQGGLCLEVSLSRGSLYRGSLSGNLCSGHLCQGVLCLGASVWGPLSGMSMSRGFSVQRGLFLRVSVKGFSVWGVSVWGPLSGMSMSRGFSVQRSLFLWVSVQGYSVWGISVRGPLSGMSMSKGFSVHEGLGASVGGGWSLSQRDGVSALRVLCDRDSLLR